jgi:hypothetical protein
MEEFPSPTDSSAGYAEPWPAGQAFDRRSRSAQRCPQAVCPALGDAVTANSVKPW